MSKFTCCKCKQTYKKKNDDEWNDLKAAEEMLTLYPETKNDPTDVLCDNCFELFKIWFNTLTAEEKKKSRMDYYEK